MRLSRRAELLSLIALWIGSLISLALVVAYAVLPNLPHDRQLSLSLFGGATMMSPSAVVPDTDGSGPCHAALQVAVPPGVPLLPPNAPPSPQFTVYFNLPFGAATATEPELDTEACKIKAGGFITRMRELDSFAIWVDDDDHEHNAYFNCSTGASNDQFLTAYDATSDPPTLRIIVRQGSGVALATKFFIALCAVGVLLAAMGLLLRWWQDRHPPPSQSEAGRRDRSQFAPLEGEDDELGGGEQEYRLASTPARGSTRASRSSHPSSSSHRAGAGAGDIELVEDPRFDRDELEALEYKDQDLEQVDPPSRGRMQQPAAAAAALDSGASSPRTPVPKLHPPPAPANASADLSAEELSRDLELASFEEEMLRHQNAIGSLDGYKPSS